MDKFVQKFATSFLSRAALVGTVAVLAAVIYIVSAYNLTGQGYPLDDAWIHQTYARNLAEFEEWSFIPGSVSGGSTSPLWTIILSLGHTLGYPVIWTYLIGIVFFAGSAIFGMEILLRNKCSTVCGILFGLFIATEWHIIWASVSGMETILLIFVITLFFYFLQSNKLIWMAGLLAGLAIWIRPDSVTLIGPFLWVILFSGVKNEINWKSVLIGCISFFLILGAYLIFNHSLTGMVWPNTFYAKQAEYAELQTTPVVIRFLKLAYLPWIGATILLLPGLIVTIFEIIRLRKLVFLAPVLWALGYITIFAVRLPVTYQHGRYVMPAMLILFLVSFWGVQRLLLSLDFTIPWQRILKRSWVLAIGIAQVFFLFLGTQSYAKDVAIINTEMVQTAHWIRENIHKDALVAAHDIGALGYFSERVIIDLAGLISPDVIPIIRDEERLANYLTENNADYLVIFPSWYPLLAATATPVYYSNDLYAPEMGGENMFVYKWQP